MNQQLTPNQALAQDLYILRELVKRTERIQVLIRLPDDLQNHVRDMINDNNADVYGLHALYRNEDGRHALREVLEEVEDLPFYATREERIEEIQKLINSINNLTYKFDAIYRPPLPNLLLQMRRSPNKSVKRSRKAKKSIKRSRKVKKNVKRSKKVKKSIKFSMKTKKSVKRSVKRSRKAKKSVKRTAKRSVKRSVRKTRK